MRIQGTGNMNGTGILLAEGDDCLRILVREYLESDGFEVKDASTAAEALRLAGGWGGGNPKLLVTAMRLPDVTGAQLAGILRRRGRSGLAVVYLVFDELNMETLKGADRHVQKPFSFLQLRSAIEEALAGMEPVAQAARALPAYPKPWQGYG